MKNQDQFLYIKKPNGRYAIANPDAVVGAANRIVEAVYFQPEKTPIHHPHDAREAIYLRMHCEYEAFVVMFLDSKHRVLELKEMFRGTIDNASVPIREVVKDALKVNASAAIVSHNHLSGVNEPSAADKSLTETLYLALGMVGVKLLDHFIFGDGGYQNAYSFAEYGALSNTM